MAMEEGGFFFLNDPLWVSNMVGMLLSFIRDGILELGVLGLDQESFCFSKNLSFSSHPGWASQTIRHRVTYPALFTKAFKTTHRGK